MDIGRVMKNSPCVSCEIVYTNKDIPLSYIALYLERIHKVHVHKLENHRGVDLIWSFMRGPYLLSNFAFYTYIINISFKLGRPLTIPLFATSNNAFRWTWPARRCHMDNWHFMEIRHLVFLIFLFPLRRYQLFDSLMHVRRHSPLLLRTLHSSLLNSICNSSHNWLILRRFSFSHLTRWIFLISGIPLADRTHFLMILSFEPSPNVTFFASGIFFISCHVCNASTVYVPVFIVAVSKWDRCAWTPTWAVLFFLSKRSSLAHIGFFELEIWLISQWYSDLNSCPRKICHR